MFLVDANILVYSTDEDSEHHAAARDWLDERTAGAPRSVGLPWPSLLAFFRIVTNPRIYSPPATAADAWQRIEDWLSRSAAWIPVPGSRHQQVLSGIVRECRPAGNLVPDAHLAALALEHGLTVVSTDTDFAKFPGVAWLNPISATALWGMSGRIRGWLSSGRLSSSSRIPASRMWPCPCDVRIGVVTGIIADSATITPDRASLWCDLADQTAPRCGMRTRPALPGRRAATGNASGSTGTARHGGPGRIRAAEASAS